MTTGILLKNFHLEVPCSVFSQLYLGKLSNCIGHCVILLGKNIGCKRVLFHTLEYGIEVGRVIQDVVCHQQVKVINGFSMKYGLEE